MLQNKILFFVSVSIAIAVMGKNVPPVEGVSCPDRCHCQKNFQIVDCQRRGLTAVPKGIPETVREFRLDGNALSVIQSDAFSALIHLQKLYLRNCKITRIEPGAFKDQDNMTDLYLSSNVLADFNATSLQGLQNVKMLHLGDNKLQAVPDLAPLLALESFVIDTNELTNASFPEGFQKLTNLKRLTLSNNKVTRLGDRDLGALRHSKLTTITLTRNSITQIENRTFEPIAETLKSLSLGHNKLSSVALRDGLYGVRQSALSSLDITSLSFGGEMNGDTFKHLNATPLLKLKMQMNSVHSLNPGLFSYLTKLDYLDASLCQITFIERDAFAGMENLKELRLNGNFLKKVPTHLPQSLRKLDLSHNNNIEFTDYQFSGMRSIETLDFRLSGIERVPSFSFAGLVKIKTLDLSQNRISTIGKSVFGMLHRLKTLRLNDNNIGLIQSAIFSSSSSLEYLDLSNNYIGCSGIPLDIFAGTSKLRTLLLNNNDLGCVFKNDHKGVLFKTLNKVDVLMLERNRISKLWPAQFQNLTAVAKLALGANQISFWSSKQFSSMASLSHLDLSQNMISLVNSSSVDGLAGGLTSLNLTDNPFACTCDLVWFRRWINNTNITLPHLDSYTCYMPPERRGLPLLEFNPDKIDCTNHLPVYLAATGGGTLLLILCTVIWVYRWRWYLKLRFYRLKRRVAKREAPPGYEQVEGEDIMGTAFVSFCASDDEDRKWVEDELLMRMDSQAPNAGRFRLFTELGFNPGESELEGIMDAIGSTKKAIVVLSEAYLNDNRCVLYDLEQILYEPIGRPDGYDMILVLRGPIQEYRRIKKIIQQRLERREFLEWTDDVDGQQLFWNQLEEKLEHRPIDINV